VIASEELALVRGWDETRATLRRWRARPFATLWPWALGSLAIAVALLFATWLVATQSTPDPDENVFSFQGGGAWADYAFVLYRNSLVLALHAMACVAGFIAGSSLPVAATGEEGFACQASELVPRRSPSATLRWRRVHDHAGRLAMGFVAAATLFSLGTQAYALGVQASSVAYANGVGPALLLASLLPHAAPELFALFLPLAAWLLASRRRASGELLAATIATTAVAVPVLLGAAAIEVWVSPHVLSFLK
jgi:stage II sporulation SpoM-like protein